MTANSTSGDTGSAPSPHALHCALLRQPYEAFNGPPMRSDVQLLSAIGQATYAGHIFVPF